MVHGLLNFPWCQSMSFTLVRMPGQARHVLRTLVRQHLSKDIRKAIKLHYSGDGMPFDTSGAFVADNAQAFAEGKRPQP